MSEKKKKVEETVTNEEMKKVQDRLFVLTPEVEQSIDILIQCANIAQKGGLLSLQDASYANQAVMVLGQFITPAPVQQENGGNFEEALKENNEENKQ